MLFSQKDTDIIFVKMINMKSEIIILIHFSLHFVEQHHDTWKLNLDIFGNLQMLLQRFIDANELLELHCLYAIQSYLKKLEFPSGE